jgi:hypothetical protein
LQSVLCPPHLILLFATQLPCIACHPLVSHPPPLPIILLSATRIPHVFHRPLLLYHPLPTHPSHTLPQFDCCIPPLVVPAALSLPIIEDCLLIVLHPSSPPAAAAARYLLCNLCTYLHQGVQNVLFKIAQ